MRYILIAAGVVVVLLVAAQVVLPPFLAGKVEDRLTARGGSANVDLEAVPAVRLLANEGDKFKLAGHGLEFPLDQKQSVFDKLDGFDTVQVSLTDVTAGPFTVRRFDLARGDRDKDYRLTSSGVSSVAKVSSYLTSGLPPLLSSILNGAARGATGPAAERPVPFKFAAEFASDGGEPRLVSSAGTVAGIPTGPFAALLAQAVLSRL